MSIAFDTLEYANKLKKAGFTDEQAEVQAHAFAEIVTETLATKADLNELEMRLKYDLTVRMGGMLTGVVAVIAVLMKTI